MNRRNFMKNLLLAIPGISILSNICLAKYKPSAGDHVRVLSQSELEIEREHFSKHFFEQRTMKYLRNLPVWDESKIFKDKDFGYKEYLFTGGCEKEDFLDKMAKEIDYVLVYTPRWIAREKGHFFDLVTVKIGKKNIVNTTGRTIII
jgi:hypothetical protein